MKLEGCHGPYHRTSIFTELNTNDLSVKVNIKGSVEVLSSVSLGYINCLPELSKETKLFTTQHLVSRRCGTEPLLSRCPATQVTCVDKRDRILTVGL